jgi:O-methyltransferase involved in polyketide biosynthesis
MSVSSSELGSVQKTLFLPLWGRAVEAGKAHPMLVDQTAVDILAAIDFDFSTIARNISFVSQLAWIARSLHTDRTIRDFLTRHPDATFVNLGCGLDTTFERVDNGRLRWYDLDLPDVIELRKKYIPERDRTTRLACSLLDDAWMRQIPVADSVFFLASGVLYYLEESQVKSLLIRLTDTFPGSEILFDACSPRGVRMANRRVIQAGGMDESAILRWGLRRAKDLEKWDSRIVVLAEYPSFQNMKHGLTVREKWGMFLSDRLGIMSMVHLRLGSLPAASERL